MYVAVIIQMFYSPSNALLDMDFNMKMFDSSTPFKFKSVFYVHTHFKLVYVCIDYSVRVFSPLMSFYSYLLLKSATMIDYDDVIMSIPL